MANKSDYRVRKCTDNKFRIFCSAEMLGRGKIPQSEWGKEMGYNTRQEALGSVGNFTYKQSMV